MANAKTKKTPTLITSAPNKNIEERIRFRACSGPYHRSARSAAQRAHLQQMNRSVPSPIIPTR